MEPALKEFLAARNIQKTVMDLLDYEKIDVSVIVAMEADDLQTYFPKHGDRVAVLQFCRDLRNSTKVKNNLLEKLRKKMRRKKNEDVEDSSSVSSYENEKHCKKKKETRQIEVGWIHNGKQVRTKNGGGTRKIDIQKNAKKKEVIKFACDLFFPDGQSTKGHVANMHLDLTDFKHKIVDPIYTVEEQFQLSKLSRIRFYLKSEKKLHIDNLQNGTENYLETSVPVSQIASVAEIVPVTESVTADINVPELFVNIFGSTDNNHIQTEYMTSEANNNIIIESNYFESTINGPEVLILHRGNIFEDLVEAFKQNFFDYGQIKIEMILPNGEKEFAEDFGGVLRDALSEFWQTYYENHTLGTNLKVPYMRHDVGDEKLEAISKILLRGYECERYIPIRLAPVFLKTCLGYSFENQELIENFLNYLSESETDLVKQAMDDFENIENEDLIDFLSPFDMKRLPTKDNIKQLISEIAYQEIIRKPSHFIRCFERVSKILHIRITEQNLENSYISIKPTAKNCLAKIHLQTDDVGTNEMTVFNYLKKFVKECDEKTRAALFRFTTGSDLAIHDIKITFTNSSGYSRSPVAHTCTGLLELPSTYENFVAFRSEMNSLLNSNVWIMDII